MVVTSAPSSGHERERRRGAAFGERLIDLPDGVRTEHLYDELFSAHPFSFWLDAGADATEGLSFLGTGDELVVQGEQSTIRAGVDSGPGGGRIVTVTDIGEHMRQRFEEPAEAGSRQPSLGGFTPGWVGFFGYEWRSAGSSTTVARLSRGDADALDGPQADADRKIDERGTPEAAFLRVTRLLVIDHAARLAAVVWRGDTDDEGWADRAVVTIGRGGLARTSSADDAADGVAAAVWRHGRATYSALIDRCRASIGRGDAYQLCLTNRIDVPGAFDPARVFRTLRRTSPTQRGGLLRFGDLSLVSASPEKFLGLDRSGRIEVRPIKGTRPRSSDAARDRERADELRASPKERAENLMIVDLMRNDVGRVSALGSVRVDTLFDVESYAQVHQLVSTVSGQLADGCDAVDVLASTFPAGSMTGAPKQSAIDILGRLEGAPRGLYAGAFGMVGADGTLDLSMVIRSIVIDAHGASVGAGGGITWSSDAAAEVDEMVLKARAPLSALGAPGHPPD